MKYFKERIYNRLVYSKKHICAKAHASKIENSRWLCIYPVFNKNSEYTLLDFELNNLNMHNFVGDEDLIMENKTKSYVNGLENMIKILLEKGVEPSCFENPWDVDYPI